MITRTSHRRILVFALKTVGKIPIVFTTLIIFFITITSIFIIVPNIYSNIFPCIIISSTGILLNFLIFYYFYKSITSPFDTLQELMEKNPESLGISAIYCHKCLLRIPYHAHHCNVCDCCIMNHDHHCIFLNRCIGDGNFEYFNKFLNYCIAGTGFNLFVTFPQILDLIRLRGIYKMLALRQSLSFISIAINAVVLTFTLSLRLINAKSNSIN